MCIHFLLHTLLSQLRAHIIKHQGQYPLIYTHIYHHDVADVNDNKFATIINSLSRHKSIQIVSDMRQMLYRKLRFMLYSPLLLSDDIEIKSNIVLEIINLEERITHERLVSISKVSLHRL